MSSHSSWLAAIAAIASLTAAASAQALPSYARQLRVPCNACHTQFPDLNAFGRQFKLSGYTLSSGAQIQSQTKEQTTLSLPGFLPVSLMFQAAYTETSEAQPGVQNGDTQFPQQMSLFLAGKISPKMGSFLQLTYSQEDDKFGMDNAEIRFADNAMLSGKPVSYGVTLNNAPTVEDLWNSTPVWGFPWAGPDVSPAPAAAALVDGELAQDVAGLGAFAFWNSTIYAATTLYRSAHLGTGAPTVGSESTIDSIAPYWRVAWQHNWGANTLEVGGYGIQADLVPEGISGATDKYRDIAADFQYEKVLRGHQLSVHGTFIHEKKDLDATFAAGGAENPSNDLDTFRLDGSYYYNDWRFSLGYFSTTGDRDTELYAPGQVDGSANGSPDSRGWIMQGDYALWQNVRVMLQYTGFSKFNGAKSNYDGFGRDAADNNTIYFLGWFVW
jgi:hypothetical protein